MLRARGRGWLAYLGQVPNMCSTKGHIRGMVGELVGDQLEGGGLNPDKGY